VIRRPDGPRPTCDRQQQSRDALRTPNGQTCAHTLDQSHRLFANEDKASAQPDERSTVLSASARVAVINEAATMIRREPPRATKAVRPVRAVVAERFVARTAAAASATFSLSNSRSPSASRIRTPPETSSGPFADAQTSSSFARFLHPHTRVDLRQGAHAVVRVITKTRLPFDDDLLGRILLRHLVPLRTRLRLAHLRDVSYAKRICGLAPSVNRRNRTRARSERRSAQPSRRRSASAQPPARRRKRFCET
jgi:hypothetical protein